MRISISTLAIIFLSNNFIFSQISRYSVAISGGYAFGALRQNIGKSGSLNSHNNFSSSNDDKEAKASLGKGYNLQLDVSRSLIPQLDAGIASVYHWGSPISYTYSVSNTISYSGLSSSSNTVTTNKHDNIQQIQIVPYFKLTTKDTSRKPLFIKMGAIFAFNNQMTLHLKTTGTSTYPVWNPNPPYNYTSVTVPVNTDSSIKYNEGFCWGYFLSLGFERSVSKRISIYPEFIFNYLQWKYKKPEPATTPLPYSSYKIQIGVRYIFAPDS